MTSKAQLYLNEQTAERSFEKELAAKDREIEWLKSAGHKQGQDIADSVVLEIAERVEAMRAKCEDIVREAAGSPCLDPGIDDDLLDIADAIAALKIN